MKKKQMLLVIILTMLLSAIIPVGLPVYADTASISSTDHTFDINEGDITITAVGHDDMIAVTHGTSSVTKHVYAIDRIVITGSTTANRVVVDGVTANITLGDVNIDASLISDQAAFELKNTAAVALTLQGNNALKGGERTAGLQVPEGNTITIAGTGTLHATGGERSAGIGGGNGGAVGSITISGGTVTATGGNGGAGIGGGVSGSGGSIAISGGYVTAIGEGTVSMASGAGIGSGVSGSVDSIMISGGNVSATGGIYYAAGIGGGFYGSVDSITISGGDITAIAGNSAAGIGGGSDGSVDSITISGGEVTAIGGDHPTWGGGAGIGGGSDGSVDSITISGGNITATAGSGGAGIGGGERSSGTITITIINHPTIIATGNGGADIGSGRSAYEVTIIKDADGRNLTYLRLEVNNGQSSLPATNVRIDGNQYQTNQAGITGFFLKRTSDTEHRLIVENKPVEIKILPGDVQNSRMTVDIGVAKLTGLAVSDYALVPVFDGGHDQYTANVANRIETIEILPIGPPGVIITINGETSPFNDRNLEVGDNDFQIKVTVEETNPTVKYQTTYTLTVNREASDNTNLKSLTLSQGILNPAFGKETLIYTTTVGHGINSITLDAEAEDAKAQVMGTGIKSLVVGANTIEVKVIAEDGTEKIYQIVITRTATNGGGSSGGSSGGGGSFSSISIGKTNPTQGTAGSQYTYSLTATGGSGGYSFEITSGELPAGLTLSKDGVISGTPTKSGTYQYTITATDLNGRVVRHNFTQVIGEEGIQKVNPSKKQIRLTIGKLETKIEDETHLMDAFPFIDGESNRTLVPIKFISEALGAEVVWLPETRQILIKQEEKEILLTIGSKEVLVNGEIIIIDCEPRIMPPGRTFVPLRFVSELLGAMVEYDVETREISIIK